MIQKLINRCRAVKRRATLSPPLGLVRFGSFARIEPISRVFGFDRGQPVDRYYIDKFIQQHRACIRGRCLEIGDDAYTRKYGSDTVSQIDVLHAVEGNPKATIVGDLATGENVPDNAYDCVICTQTLNFIRDPRCAIATLHRSLVVGGVTLVTVPGISQISRYDMDRWGDFWRFTDLSARSLFEEAFGKENVVVETFGNVLAACAFLHGLASSELSREELDHQDQDYQLTIGIRAHRRD